MNAPLSTREFASLLFGRNCSERLIVMIRAAFDASMDNPKRGVTAVAGFIGLVDGWDRLEERWNAQLAVHGLEKFRLTDVFHRYSSVDGALSCVSDFVEVVRHSQMRFVCAHMLDTDWDQLPHSPEYLSVCPDRQHACLDLLLSVLAQELDLEFRGMPAAVVFDNDYGGTEKAARVYEAWRARKGHPGFGTIAFTKGEMEWDVVPLQCADLLAGLIRKEPISRASLNALADNYPEEAFLTRMSKLLNRLMANGRGTRWSTQIGKDIAEILKKRSAEKE